jgi:hypothetical protein
MTRISTRIAFGMRRDLTGAPQAVRWRWEIARFPASARPGLPRIPWLGFHWPSRRFRPRSRRRLHPAKAHLCARVHMGGDRIEARRVERGGLDREHWLRPDEWAVALGIADLHPLGWPRPVENQTAAREREWLESARCSDLSLREVLEIHRAPRAVKVTREQLRPVAGYHGVPTDLNGARPARVDVDDVHDRYSGPATEGGPIVFGTPARQLRIAKSHVGRHQRHECEPDRPAASTSRTDTPNERNTAACRSQAAPCAERRADRTGWLLRVRTPACDLLRSAVPTRP